MKLTDEEYLEKLLSWFQKEKPEQFAAFKENINFKDGKVSINDKNGLKELDRELLIRILDNHPPFEQV